MSASQARKALKAERLQVVASVSLQEAIDALFGNKNSRWLAVANGTERKASGS